jgi:hypothetical protein
MKAKGKSPDFLIIDMDSATCAKISAWLNQTLFAPHAVMLCLLWTRNAHAALRITCPGFISRPVQPRARTLPPSAVGVWLPDWAFCYWVQR